MEKADGSAILMGVGMVKGAVATGQRVCHVQVRDVAKAAAGQLYEAVMSENSYYEVWKKQNPGLNNKELSDKFIEQNWHRCIDFARHTLTIMLTRDDISEAVKTQIMDVLEKDYSLRQKHVAAPPLQRMH